jgi:hypothetical protein
MPFRYDVPMLDGSTYKVTRLLAKGDDNLKTFKSDKAEVGVETVSLSLSPAFTSGFNLCTSSSPGCVQDCIHTAGNAMIFPEMIHKARIAKARFFKLDKQAFINRLTTELSWALRRATRRDNKLFVRLNIFSDVMWEREHPAIFSQFPNVQFYDYTAHYLRYLRYLDSRRGLGTFPRNYHLTFSRKENNWQKCEEILYKAGNVAVPFAVTRTKPLPRYWNGFKVLDGDLTDLRPLDPQNGYVIGLRAKGRGRLDKTSGFIVDLRSANTTGG